jgi:hypothetical protein
MTCVATEPASALNALIQALAEIPDHPIVSQAVEQLRPAPVLPTWLQRVHDIGSTQRATMRIHQT